MLIKQFLKQKESGGIIQTVAFNNLYQNYYSGSFPEYYIEEIISKEKLQTLYNATSSTDYTRRNGLKERLNSTTYLACHIAPTTYIPTIYITKSLSSFNNQQHGKCAGIYYKGEWYFQKDFNVGYVMPVFGNKTEEEKEAILLYEEKWTPVKNL